MIYLGITYGNFLQFVEQTKSFVITDLDPYDLIKYTNSNYAGDPKDQKLVIKYLIGAIDFWYSKKQ